MGSKSIIEGICNDGLCLGCGLCESICGKESVEMKMQKDGFFRPVVKKMEKDKEKLIDEICPGINIVNDLTFTKEQKVWGKIDGLFSGYSVDKEIRTQGSSGGIVSGIAVYMLGKGLVDAVLQVGGDSQDYERNSLNISKTREDVIRCASSRYAPALIFDKILELLDSNSDVYCFIGKPCDISALKNFLKVFPKYKNRFKLTVSIMCAGMPSFKGTASIIDDMGAEIPVRNLVYRGNGWPGYFSFIDRNEQSYQCTYNDSWGKTLNKFLNFRCKICPDGIGLQADIAVGDAWETKDGYPDFTEREGQSLVIARTQGGLSLLMQASDEHKMQFSPLHEEKIAMMQPYQYQRRQQVGARLLAYTLAKRRFLNFKNVWIWHNMLRVKPRFLYWEFKGILKRAIKKTQYGS